MRSHRQPGDGKTTVNEFLKRFRECEELSYPLPEEVTNEFIAERLYHKTGKSADAELYRDFDPEEVCRALTRKGETLKHFGTAQLHIPFDEVWLMPFGYLLDLWECHRQFTGMAKPKREMYIDDIIPDGI